jgi:hypothetical protein
LAPAREEAAKAADLAEVQAEVVDLEAAASEGAVAEGVAAEEGDAATRTGTGAVRTMANSRISATGGGVHPLTPDRYS